VGGNLINYPDNVSTPTAEDLTTTKLLLNSTVSAPQVKFIVADIKDFYLNTKMFRYKYMRLPLTLIPTKIIVQYKLPPWSVRATFIWRSKKAYMDYHQRAY
jgi:hypothetical protein